MHLKTKTAFTIYKEPDWPDSASRIVPRQANRPMIQHLLKQYHKSHAIIDVRRGEVVRFSVALHTAS